MARKEHSPENLADDLGSQATMQARMDVRCPCGWFHEVA